MVRFNFLCKSKIEESYIALSIHFQFPILQALIQIAHRLDQMIYLKLFKRSIRNRNLRFGPRKSQDYPAQMTGLRMRSDQFLLNKGSDFLRTYSLLRSNVRPYESHLSMSGPY